MVVPALLTGCSLLAPYDDFQRGEAAKSTQSESKDAARDELDCRSAGDCAADSGPNVPAEPYEAGAIGSAETLFTADGPIGLALRGGELFWATPHAGLWRAKIGSTPLRIDLPADAVDDAFDIDVTTTHVYWSELSGNRVRAKPRAGGAATTVGTGSGRCAFLVVVGSTTYVSDDFVAEPSRGSIVADGVVLYPNLNHTTGVSSDGASLFWAHATKPTTGSTFQIVEGTIDGTSSVVDVPAVAEPAGVAVDDTYLYAIDRGQRIVRKARRTASPADVVYASGTDMGRGDLAVDDAWIYWTEPVTGRIRRRAKPP